MRHNGETPLPGPTILESGSNFEIPSREPGRQLPCRVFRPEKGQSKGVFQHIHGGGWVLQTEKDQDPLLKFFADATQTTVVSVGYRLAPENPFPAGPEDCYDAGEWLVDNAKRAFGGDLLFIGGESAGGHLSAATAFHLMKTRPQFEFKALMLSYGCFDVSMGLPQVQHFDQPLILTHAIMANFVEAFTPGMTAVQRRDPAVSPFYANLPKLAAQTPSKKLPPAIFSIGTADILMDDTMVFAMKWMMSGAEALVKVYPGAPHGFSLFPPDVSEASGEYRRDVVEFIEGVVGASPNL